MKKNIRTLTLIAFAILTCFSSCKKNPEEKIEDAKEEVLDAKQEVIEAKQDALANYESFKMRINDKITANELKIAELKVKAIDVSKEAKANYNERIIALEVKNKALKTKIDGYGEYDATTWEEFQENLDKEIKQLEKEFNSLNNK